MGAPVAARARAVDPVHSRRKTHMPERWRSCRGILIRGRVFTQRDLVMIRKLIRDHPSWGRTKLSERICEQFGWFQPSGRVKDRACRVALLRLEQMGFLRLPPRKIENGGRPPARIQPRSSLLPTRPVSDMPAEIILERVDSPSASRLWNWIMTEYHYLGAATPVGRTIRYLVLGDDVLVGAIGFSECAWSIAARNEALRSVGLNPACSRQFIVANNRFLILPSAKVPNLASRVLSASVHRVTYDWADRFGSRPLLAETFVDPSKFQGTCYFAANWLLIGVTKGFAKRGSSHRNERTPKLLLLRGIDANIHRKLQIAYPPGGRAGGKKPPEKPRIRCTARRRVRRFPAA